MFLNIFYIILIILAVIVLLIIFIFNRLVVLANRAKEAWADIDVQLKRRYDLIPNLVEAVKGYAGHEREVFEKVTEARSAAMLASKTGDPKQIGQTENFLAGTLKTLFAVSENYPQLRASENFQKLQDELTDTENKIQAARRFYNANVRDLNIQIESFPSNIVASIFRFTKRDFFELEETEVAKEPVKVQF